jgi:hypothetical protein
VSAVTATAEGLARFEARGPCTDAERRAAGWLHDELRAAGHEAWVETHWVRPQWALSLALHATVGVVASVAAISAALPALIAAGVAALSMAVEAAGYAGLLRLAFPRRATQNVLVPEAEAGVMLLVCAPYAAPRGGLGARAFARLRGSPQLWVAAALALVAVCAGLRLLDLEGLWLGLLQFVPTVSLLLALAAAGDVAVASYVRGGEAAPAVAIALHDELRREQAGRLSPALILHGALRAHLRREKPDRRRTVVLQLVPGRAGFASSHPRLRAAAARAGEAVGGPGPAPLCGVRVRIPSLVIGVPDDPAGAAATLDFALACVDAADAELA